MNHAHQLLYKSFKATICGGAVALATSASAQTPWQASPALPASLSVGNPSTNAQQSGGQQLLGQSTTSTPNSAAKPNNSNQKPVTNRYTTGTPAAQQQPYPPTYSQFQPGQPTPGSYPQYPANNPGQPNLNQQYAYPQTASQQPQSQFGSAPVGQRPTSNGNALPPQYAQPYQVQYQQQYQQQNQPGQVNAGLPVQPPAMVPFNPNGQTNAPTNLAVGSGGYKAVDLPPPGVQPTTPLSPPVLNSSSENQVAAQSLMNAIQGAPSLVQAPTNYTQAASPQLQPPSISTNQQPLQAGSSASKPNGRDLPGAGQLLPRNAPTPTQNGTANPASSNRGSIAHNSNDPEAFQGRIPTIDDLPVPDITGLDTTKNLLVSSQRNVDAGPVTSEPWNTKLVAIVGNERVLAGDMAAVIEPIIVQNKARLRNKKEETDARLMLVRQLLPEYVSMKALQQQFFKDIAGNVPPKELQKKKDEIMSKASKAFYDKYVPIELYRKYKVDDLAELESTLQESGLGLNIMKNHFLMQVLAMQCEDKYVANSFEIPPGDILDYYEKNIDKWRIPARVKWRELVIRFDKHPSKEEARSAINNLGNEVFLTGKPFEAVARDSSEGHNAKEGGTYDWTTAGSLRSEVIEKALFNLPLKRLSEVIEDDVGYHIVEVLEREAARIQDMSEIQTEIRNKLSNDIRAEKLKELKKKILIRTPIWTMWPEDIQGSKPLVDVQESE